MAVGRFLAMVGVLVWRRDDGKYLLLQRSPAKDFAAGEWECASGRLEQGEGFVEAVRREAREELSLDVRIECLLGTAHFYRGDKVPENEMVGVHFGCSIPNDAGLRLSEEHSTHRWVTAEEAQGLFPPDHWMSRLISRAEAFRELMPQELQQLHWKGDLEY